MVKVQSKQLWTI